MSNSENDFLSEYFDSAPNCATTLEFPDLDWDPDFIESRLRIRFLRQVSEIMQNAGISQSKLAGKLQVSRQAVSRMLDDSHKNVTLRTLAKLSSALRHHISLSLEPNDFHHPELFVLTKKETFYKGVDLGLNFSVQMEKELENMPMVTKEDVPLVH